MRRLGFGIGVLLAAVWVVPLQAQEATGTIRGHVADSATLRPLQGVTIAVGGKSVVSGADGYYIVKGVPAGTDSLRARSIGYTPFVRAITVTAGDTLTVDLVLTVQAVNLAEIVSIGYGDQAAGNIIGAVSQVNSTEFNPGRTISPSELIQGKVAGVQVVENNEPGGGTTIRIRGATSVNASSDPLVVVDGLPLGNGVSGGRDPLNFLNSNDIASVTVLRDAAAAAIYGANAANGVILITTKTAHANQKPKFEYSGSATMSTIDRLPSMLNADQFRAAVTQYAPNNVPQLLNSNTDWFGEVDRTAWGQDQNFAVSGSGTGSNYRLSFGYLDQSGVISATNAKRFTVGVNYNQLMLSDRLNLKFNLRGYRQADQFTPGGVISNAAQMGPTQPITDPTTPTGYYDWSGGLQSADNPVAIMNLASDKSTTYRGIGNLLAGLSLPFVNGLTLNGDFGFDASRADRVQFTPGSLHSEIKSGHYGNYFRTNPNEASSTLETYLDYAVPKHVGPGALDLVGGYSYSTSHSEFPTVQAESLSTDLLGPNGIPAAKTTTAILNVVDSKLISFYGRVNYNINDRYLAAFTIRRDGSSRFGSDHRWGTFPSLALAWRLSEEGFLRNVSWLSDLKLRGSWAKTGNQGFADFQYLTTYTYGDAQSQYWMGSDGFVTTIRPSAVDPNIKWEETRSVNFGIDYGFKNQRFSGAIDWYDKKTTDLIFSVPAAAGTVPGDFVTTNIGSMQNRGIEFSLSARVLDGAHGGLGYTADFNVAHNSNELLTITPQGGSAQQILVGGISGGVGSTIQVLRPGVPINSFYVYEHVRDASGKPIYTDTNNDGTINEQDLYKDQNGDGIINQNDLRPFHDPAPKWIFGHSSYFTYAKFDFGFTLRAYTGNYVYNNVASNLGTYSEVTRGSPYNLHSSVLQTGFVTPQYFSDFYVEDASFLRMDNITLGYTFNISRQPARVFGTLQNAFTISGYSGVDPTAGVNGIDNNIYPRSRKFTTGISLQF